MRDGKCPQLLDIFPKTPENVIYFLPRCLYRDIKNCRSHVSRIQTPITTLFSCYGLLNAKELLDHHASLPPGEKINIFECNYKQESAREHGIIRASPASRVLKRRPAERSPTLIMSSAVLSTSFNRFRTTSSLAEMLSSCASKVSISPSILRERENNKPY